MHPIERCAGGPARSACLFGTPGPGIRRSAAQICDKLRRRHEVEARLARKGHAERSRPQAVCASFFPGQRCALKRALTGYRQARRARRHAPIYRAPETVAPAGAGTPVVRRHVPWARHRRAPLWRSRRASAAQSHRWETRRKACVIGFPQPARLAHSARGRSPAERGSEAVKDWSACRRWPESGGRCPTVCRRRCADRPKSRPRPVHARAQQWDRSASEAACGISKTCGTSNRYRPHFQSEAPCISPKQLETGRTVRSMARSGERCFLVSGALRFSLSCRRCRGCRTDSPIRAARRPRPITPILPPMSSDRQRAGCRAGRARPEHPPCSSVCRRQTPGPYRSQGHEAARTAAVFRHPRR